MSMPVPRRQMTENMSFSELAWGAWRLRDSTDIKDSSDILALIEACLDLGITTFDHADIYGDYGCEALFGEALAQKPALRDRMEIVTKCDIALISPARPEHRIKHYNTSPAHIIESVEQSLRNLWTSHIDLLLIHRPDPLMNADEVADCFAALRKDGKVRHFGVSNFTPAQFDLLQSRMDSPLVTNQVEASVLETAAIFDGVLDQMQQQRAHPMIYSPLGGARLFTGKDDPQTLRLRPVLERMAEKYTLPGIAEVAIAWLLQLPCRPVPVIGTMKAARIRDAAGACHVTFDRQDWFEILQASRNQEVA